MDAAWEFYGPWLALMLWVGIPLLVVGTAAMLSVERGSFSRWVAGRVALLGWALVLLAVAGYVLLRLFEGGA